MELKRTDYSQQELDAIDLALREKGLSNNPANMTNLEQIMAWFEQNPTMPFTAATFMRLVESRDRDFEWLSAVQREFFRLSAQMTEQDKQAILDFIPRRGLLTDGENLQKNLTFWPSIC
jgi:hypothetical protein